MKTTFGKLITVSAWLLVISVLGWFGKKLYLLSQFETTNDAQVNTYINPVVSRVGGFITEIRFTDFQKVNKGDTLLIIDNKEYQSDSDQILADIHKQKNSIDALKSLQKTLSQEANEAQNEIEAFKSELWKQQLEYDRYLELFNRKSATAQQLEKNKAQLEITKSNLKKAEIHYQVALSKIEDVTANQKVILAESDRLKEVKHRKDIDFNYTVITAPYNGRLGQRKIEIGQMIKMGDHLAYIVNDEIPKWIIANFKETQIKNFKVGDNVVIIADAFPDQKFIGKIIAFSPGTGSSFSLLPPDNATGNFVKIVQRIPVKIAITGPNEEAIQHLEAGMNVEVIVKK